MQSCSACPLDSSPRMLASFFCVPDKRTLAGNVPRVRACGRGALANAAFNFIPRSVCVTKEEICAKMFRSFPRIAVDVSIFFVPLRFDVRHVPVMCYLADGVFFDFVLLCLKKKQKKNYALYVVHFSRFCVFFPFGFSGVRPVCACSFPFWTCEILQPVGTKRFSSSLYWAEVCLNKFFFFPFSLSGVDL